MYIKKPLYEHEFKEFLQKGRHSFEGEIFDFDVKKQIFDFINRSDVDNKLDFSGAEFKESVDLSYMKFHTNPTFKGAKFKKEANFTKTKFLGKGEVSFEGVEFSDKVDFTKSQLGDANFTKSNFLKCNSKRSNSPRCAGFKDSNTLSGACFKEVRFGSANFFEVEFSVSANFNKTIFKKNTKFEKTKFKEGVSFKGVEFSDKADFIGAQFKKKLDLRSIDFLVRPKFENATFNGEVKIDAIIYGESKDKEEVVKETGLPKKHGEGIKVFKGKKIVFQKEFKEKIKDKKGFFKNRHFDFDIGQHLKEEYKSGVDLKFNFADTEFSEKINCEGIVFKEEVIFENTIFKKEVNFSGVEFEESVDFSKAIFQKKINFSETKFKKKKSFLNDGKNERDKKVNFYRAEFKEKADFNKAEFEFKVVFYKAIFKNTAVFTEAKFSVLEDPELEEDQKDALIKEFKEKIKDKKNKIDRCSIDICLKNIRKEELNRYIPEIFRKLDGISFEQATFKGEARFKEAKFLSKANFYKTEFSDTANFTVAEFNNETHFGHTKFESIVHFSKSQLLVDTDFTFAVFKGLTTFRETKFAKKLSFYKTKFADHVNFNESEFKDCYKEEEEEEDAAVFWKTEFSKELDFENIIIEGDNPLKFNSVIFSRQYLTDFCEINVKKKEKKEKNEKKKTEESDKKKPASLIFEDISFPSEFVFSRCDLAKTEFRDCFIENAKFLNCKFLNSSFPLNPFKRNRFYVAGEDEKDKRKGEKDKRKSWIIVKFVWAFLLLILPVIYLFFNFVGVVCVLVILLFFISGRGLYLFYDEKKKNKNQDNEDQEQLSRQMKSSLEGSKNWKQAGDFYIGELELRRKKNGWSYFGLSIYKYYLGYAERFTVILFWIFALFFYTTGFNYKKDLDYFKETKPPEKKINMRAMETGYSEECIEATNNNESVFIIISKCSAVDSIKKSANLLIFPLTLRTQTKGFENLSDVFFVMISWPVWLALFVAIKRRFRF